MLLKTDYGTYNVVALRSTYYNNNSLAVLLRTEDGEPFCNLTVNIMDGVAEGEYQYVDTNNCPWALDFIESNNLGYSTGIVGYSGYCEYPLVKFNLENIREVK